MISSGERGNKEGKPQTPGLGGGGGLRCSTRALTQLGLFLAVWPQAGHMTSLSLLPCGSGPGRMKLGHSCRALSMAPAARGLVVGRGLWDPDPGDVLIPLCLERCILFVPWPQAFSVPFPRVTFTLGGGGGIPFVSSTKPGSSCTHSRHSMNAS